MWYDFKALLNCPISMKQRPLHNWLGSNMLASLNHILATLGFLGRHFLVVFFCTIFSTARSSSESNKLLSDKYLQSSSVALHLPFALRQRCPSQFQQLPLVLQSSSAAVSFQCSSVGALHHRHESTRSLGLLICYPICHEWQQERFVIAGCLTTA
jgi:hypothetical protein